jgi:hypothetical protein
LTRPLTSVLTGSCTATDMIPPMHSDAGQGRSLRCLVHGVCRVHAKHIGHPLFGDATYGGGTGPAVSVIARAKPSRRVPPASQLFSCPTHRLRSISPSLFIVDDASSPLAVCDVSLPGIREHTWRHAQVQLRFMHNKHSSHPQPALPPALELLDALMLHAKHRERSQLKQSRPTQAPANARAPSLERMLWATMATNAYPTLADVVG